MQLLSNFSRRLFVFGHACNADSVSYMLAYLCSDMLAMTIRSLTCILVFGHACNDDSVSYMLARFGLLLACNDDSVSYSLQ